jgi:hypothetical protein
MGIKLTMLVVIGTDCIGSCKSNYHTSMTTTPTGRIDYKGFLCMMIPVSFYGISYVFFLWQILFI